MKTAHPCVTNVRALTAITAVIVLQAALPTSAVAYLNGLDVYSGDGAITWSSVKNAGYDFVFVKANEGVNATDSQFATNMAGAHAAGMYVGTYHFAHVESLSPAGTTKFDNYTGGAFAYDSPTQVNRDAWLDATREAVDYIKLIRPYYQRTGDTRYLLPVSDIEMKFMPALSASLKREFVSNWAKLFADTVYDAIGVRPMLYVSKASANENFTAAVAQQQAFWIAWYKGTGTASPPVKSDTPNFPLWSFWQWSDGEDAIAQANQIPGTSTTIDHDRDIFNGTLAQLDALTVQNVRGDYNHNDSVDSGDYVLWRKQMSYSTPKYDAYSIAFLGADGSLNNKVDAADYTYWRSQYGKTLSGAGSGSELDSAGVPEPSSLALLLCSGLFIADRRSRRRPH